MGPTADKVAAANQAADFDTAYLARGDGFLGGRGGRNRRWFLFLSLQGVFLQARDERRGQGSRGRFLEEASSGGIRVHNTFPELRFC